MVVGSVPANGNKCNIVTSTKEVMFSPGFVSPSVCLFVNNITQKLMDG